MKSFYSLHRNSQGDNVSSSYLQKGQNCITEDPNCILFIFNMYLEKPKVHTVADRLDRITDVGTYKENKLSIIMP